MSISAGDCRRGEETANSVKFLLTDRQELRLLRMGGRCNLSIVRSAQQTEYAIMNNIPLIERLAEAALAVGVTTASVVVLQLALLAG
jgi:hypothetical protein